VSADNRTGSAVEGVDVDDGADDAANLSIDRSRVVRWISIGLSALAIAALLAAGALRWINHRHDQSDADARQAAQVATTSLEQLLSFTPTDVLVTADAEGKLLAGDFAARYLAQIKGDWGPLVVKNKITSSAKVIRVARVSVNGDQVELLVYANITRTVGGSNQSDLIAPTMRITMKKVDGTWRVSQYTGV